MERKRIAFMVTAYTEPATFAALMKELDRDEIDIYIHVDKKVDIIPFYNAVKSNHIFFLPEEKRVKIGWGGYSQIEMQYNLLKMIFDAGIRYDKIVNITATDFPVVAMSKIIKEEFYEE